MDLDSKQLFGKLAVIRSNKNVDFIDHLYVFKLKEI